MLRPFLIKLTLLTIGTAVMIALANMLFPFFNQFQQFTWLCLVFFFLVTLLTGYIGFRGLTKSAHGFVASVNGMVVIKLFLSAAFVIVFVVVSRPEGPAFVVSFFILYVIYTVFEIREMILAQKGKRQQQHESR